MNSKFYKNEKFQAWFFPILYFLLAVSIIITGTFIFKKKYYMPIVVTGRSMWPTLAGGIGSGEMKIEDGSVVTGHCRYHYGLADLHTSSVNELKRFDVIVTYYPQSWNTDGDEQHYIQNRSYKIKRVWGFPGETINLSYDNNEKTYTFTASKKGSPLYKITSKPVSNYTIEYEGEYRDGESVMHYGTLSFTHNAAEFDLPYKSFKVINSKREIVNKTLADDEYYVMGDNWSASTDCYEKSSVEKLTKSYLQGRVISIAANVSYYNNVTSNMHEIPERHDF